MPPLLIEFLKSSSASLMYRDATVHRIDFMPFLLIELMQISSIYLMLGTPPFISGIDEGSSCTKACCIPVDESSDPVEDVDLRALVDLRFLILYSIIDTHRAARSTAPITVPIRMALTLVLEAAALGGLGVGCGEVEGTGVAVVKCVTSNNAATPGVNEVLKALSQS